MNAERIYKRFTTFDPDRILTMPLKWPSMRDVCLLGIAKSISYRSDKWNKEGKAQDYIHHHKFDPPVLVIGSKITGYPSAPYLPRGNGHFAMLGRKFSHCTELEYIDALSQKKIKLDFSILGRFPYLAAHQDGMTLLIHFEGTRPILVTGPGLRITARGITG